MHLLNPFHPELHFLLPARASILMFVNILYTYPIHFFSGFYGVEILQLNRNIVEWPKIGASSN